MFATHKIFTEVLDSKTCDEIIECAKKIKLNKATVTKEKIYKPNFRKANICFIPKDNEDFSTVYKYLDNFFHDANSEFFGLNLIRMQNLQFSEYDSTYQGHFDFHRDTIIESKSFYQRKLTLCVQLSDPLTYEGGNFELAYTMTDKEDLRKRGTIIIFPSLFYHRITPVTKGIRYSLVAWYEGPKWQ